MFNEPSTKVTKTNITKTSTHLDWPELKQLLTWALRMKALPYGKNPWSDEEVKFNEEVKILIKQEAEGSPSYSVERWRAWVELTEDHLAMSPEEPPLPPEAPPSLSKI